MAITVFTKTFVQDFPGPKKPTSREISTVQHSLESRMYYGLLHSDNTFKTVTIDTHRVPK